jgi:hypothetical protein
MSMGYLFTVSKEKKNHFVQALFLIILFPEPHASVTSILMFNQGSLAEGESSVPIDLLVLTSF